MGDASRVGEVRRHASQAGVSLGWNETDCGRLAIITTELATNLMRHAVGGQMWIAVRDAFEDVEIIAVDRGPGIASIAESMQDGTSSAAGSAGTGLGAISRMADDFDVASTQEGTICVARVRREGAACHDLSRALGAVCLAVVPEMVSGDAWAVVQRGTDTSAIVADGLGHGPLAAQAAQAAIDTFVESPFQALVPLLQAAHMALQGTRGAAVLAMQLQASALQYCGAGNVAGRLFSGVFDQTLIGQHGTVGVQLGKPVATSQDRPAYAVVALHTDGIASRWKTQDHTALLQRDPVLLAASILWNNTRGRDDATVVILKPQELQ